MIFEDKKVRHQTDFAHLQLVMAFKIARIWQYIDPNISYYSVYIFLE